jgi:DNA-binding FadR family transcriptional regulator
VLVARPTQRRNLPHEVTAQLLELIAASSSPDLVLPAERQLCVQLSVSRNVLREALAALHQAGVIETRGKTRIAHVGSARAQLISQLPDDPGSEGDMVLDPIEVRRMLEPEVASVAAKRASPDGVREIERWVSLMADAAERGEAVVDYDSAFHVAIARATGNRTLVELVRALNDALKPSRALSFRPERAAALALEDHQSILTAIRDQDGPAARKAMRRHLDRVERLIRASLDAS